MGPKCVTRESDGQHHFVRLLMGAFSDHAIRDLLFDRHALVVVFAADVCGSK